jgi:acetyl esterase/lipase
MALMYLAESPLNPDVNNDFYLSPSRAPESVLALFPRTFVLCGEKDPLVDDTVIFTARLKDAKKKARQEWLRMCERGVELGDHLFSKSPEEMVTVKILPGMSHGIFQMSAFLPETKQLTKLTSGWLNEMLNLDSGLIM